MGELSVFIDSPAQNTPVPRNSTVSGRAIFSFVKGQGVPTRSWSGLTIEAQFGAGGPLKRKFPCECRRRRRSRSVE
jgi:hypothetical protein